MANRETVPHTTYYLTETNVGCCLGYQQHDTSAAAAMAFKTVGDLDGVTNIMSWWTFSDVFEEGGFPTKEFTDVSQQRKSEQTTTHFVDSTEKGWGVKLCVC